MHPGDEVMKEKKQEEDTMKRFLIEDVKAGVSMGGMACGPMAGSATAEALIRDQEDGTAKYYSLVEVEGIANFFVTDESFFDRMMIEEYSDEEMKTLENSAVREYDSYEAVFEALYDPERSGDEHLLIWKFLITLVRADQEETDRIAKKSIGLCLGDFDIPLSDVESDWLDDMAEDAEDGEEEESDLKACMDEINDEFSGLSVETGMDLEEDETPEGTYTSWGGFDDDNLKDYRLEYNLYVSDESIIEYIGTPTCQKLVDGKYVNCPMDEVGIPAVIATLRRELDGWIG